MMIKDRDWSGARRHFDRAIDLNPQSAEAHRYLAFLLQTTGQLDDAIKARVMAFSFKADDLRLRSELAITLRLANRLEEAKDHLLSILAAKPGYDYARGQLGQLYLQQGRWDDAINEFKQCKPDDATVAYLSYAYARKGKLEEGEGYLKVLLDKSASGKYVSAFYIAIAYTGLNKKDQAFEYLNLAFDDRTSNMGVKVNPVFNDLHQDPRFNELLRRAGLDKYLLARAWRPGCIREQLMITSTRAAMLFLCCLIVLLSSSAGAQTQTSGCIKGTVTDAMGAVVAGAEVRLVNRTTGELRNLFSSAAGEYAFPLLPVGLYQLSIAASGFKTASIDGITVNVTEPLARMSSSEVGKAEESVTIRDASRLIQTKDRSLAVSSTHAQFRNCLWRLATSLRFSGYPPGHPPISLTTQPSVETRRIIAVNGTRTNRITSRSMVLMLTTLGVTMRRILPFRHPRQFRNSRSRRLYTMCPFGRSGGNIQIVTRSGSNELHGSGYDYFRHEALNANNPDLKAAGVERPILSRNVVGGMLGGAFKKESLSTFFPIKVLVNAMALRPIVFRQMC